MYKSKEVLMVRTQIYITENQRIELAAMSKAVGKNQSELIREAIDRLIAQEGPTKRERVLSEVAGIWKERTDLPGFAATRTGWDRD
jgi:chromosome segregation and condensation protein ScpB